MKIGILYNSPMNIGNAIMTINFVWYTNLLLSNKPHFVISAFYGNNEKEKVKKNYRLELGNNVSFSVVKGRYLSSKGILTSLVNPLGKNSLSKKLDSKILSSDIIVALGGDIFASTYGELYAIIELMGLYLFKKRVKKPVLLISQTIGPFSGWRDRISAYLLKKFDIITCRERLTYEYLANKGLRNISLVADLAFHHLPKRMQIKKEELVVLIPSRLLHMYMPSISYEEYVKLWVDLALYVRDQGFKVMFLPHAVNNEWDDDRLIIKDIHIELHRKTRDLREIYFIRKIPLPHEARYLYIGKSAVVITARMHAATSAICTGSIPLNLAYGEKSHGVLGKDFRLSNLVIDVRKVRSVKELKRRIAVSLKYILTNYEAIQQEILRKYKDKEREALKNIYLFVKLAREWL